MVSVRFNRTPPTILNPLLLTYEIYVCVYIYVIHVIFVASCASSYCNPYSWWRWTKSARRKKNDAKIRTYEIEVRDYAVQSLLRPFLKKCMHCACVRVHVR